MEMIVAVAVVVLVVWWFFFREKKEETSNMNFNVPYKIEPPIVEPVIPAVVETKPVVTEMVNTKDTRDLNKDGVVSSEEKAVWVEKLDLNKDGVVDSSEKKIAKAKTKVVKPAVVATPAKTSKTTTSNVIALKQPRVKKVTK